MTNATAASYYLPFKFYGSISPAPNPTLFSLFLGVPAIDPDMIDWFTFPSLPPFDTCGLTNLKAKDVLNPRSILCFNECHKHPDFEEFFVDVILRTLVYLSNLISPSYTSPVNVEKSLN